MRARENKKCQISQNNVLHMKFSFFVVVVVVVKFDIFNSHYHRQKEQEGMYFENV